MEHRWSLRKSIEGPVTLTLPLWDKFQADICDISLGGLAVTSARRMPINSLATLSFSLELDGRVSHHRLSAQVAHSNNRCTGFLFMEPEGETVQVLRDMLYQPQIVLLASIAGQPRAA